jgi:hypothetical protein
MNGEFRSYLATFAAEPGNRWIECRMGVSVLVSHCTQPIMIKRGTSVSQETALRLAEWQLGRWLKYDGRWSGLGAFQARIVVPTRAQPGMRITYTRERTMFEDSLDSVHNDGSLTLVGELGTQRDCWLLTSDRDASTDIVYTWTHQEWDLASDSPGAWTRSNGHWRYRKKFHPKGMPGTISVEPIYDSIAGIESSP